MGRIIDPNAPQRPAGPTPEEIRAVLEQPFLVQMRDTVVEITIGAEAVKKLLVDVQLVTLDKQTPLSLPLIVPGEALPLIADLFRQIIAKHPDLTAPRQQLAGQDAENAALLLSAKVTGEPS